MKRSYNFTAIAIIFVFALTFAVPAISSATGDGPMSSLKKPVNELIDILKDPKYKDKSAKDAQSEKIWPLIKGIFDFTTISKGTLGKYRKKFDKARLATFTEEFTTLLGETYLKKIQGGYQNETVKYLTEKIKETKRGPRAQVKTMLVRGSIEIPVHYNMLKVDGNWRIYDVKVEGVSLVKNYRTQFQKFLMKKNPDQLIEKVKKKAESLKQSKTEKE
ncbi:ABC transporter substrate-binding protein [Desulfobacterales bacterium HSG16]|nr:ABC transporter substrate-binding protein [Desulfobacterales bacterium HSG16]